MYNLDGLIKKMVFKNNNFYWSKGAQSGNLVDKLALQSALTKASVSFEDFAEVIEELKEQCSIKEGEEVPETTHGMIKAVIEEKNIFDGWFILKNSLTGTFGVFEKFEDDDDVIRMVLVGKPGDLTADKFIATVKNYGSKILVKLKIDITPLLLDKKTTHVSEIQLINRVFSEFDFNECLPRIEVDDEIHPAVLSGLDRLGGVEIPWTKKDVTINDLNPKLKEFLEKTLHHKHLCAILYAHLLGTKLPYVVYLKGEGNDGKTGFIQMLSVLFKGSIAAFQDTNQFSTFNMYGKALLSLSENQNPHLLSSTVIKKLTGGNTLNVEAKGRTGFSGSIRGLIIVDSNINLALLGEENESRRLRYFEVLPTKIEGRMNQDEYRKVLSSTPNEFINYCRICFEELNDGYGLVQNLPNHDATLIKLQDNRIKVKLDRFMVKFYKNNKFSKNLTCDRGEVLVTLEEAFPREKYLDINFDRYLRHKGVKIEGSNYVGWGKEKNDLDEQILNALPKEKI